MSGPVRARTATFAAALGLATILTVLWLGHRLADEPAIPFLWPSAPAAWIVAPAPTMLYVHRALPVDTVFTRRFTLDAVPPSAVLRVRAFRQAEVRLNGTAVLVTDDPARWKAALEADVAAHLRAGENELSVRVENAHGPPALWLALALPGEPLLSDESWSASRAGGTEVGAARADRAPAPAAFDEFEIARDLRAALHAAWPCLIAALLLAAAVSAFLHRTALRDEGAASAATPHGRVVDVALVVVAVAWCVLLIAGARGMPVGLGYDGPSHLEYIEDIRTTGALPTPDAGWETYQPPLYYALVAGVLAVADTPVSEPLGAFLLRAVHLVLALVFLVFVRLSLRLLFPERPRRQLLGLLLAAFLPVHLYIFQFPGNEVLAITLGAVCFHACLRLLQGEDPGYGRALLLGTAIGAALLAKVSAVLLLPPMLAVIVLRGLRGAPGGVRTALLLAAIVLTTSVAVGGWHCARVAARTGNPFAGNWDPALGRDWWQDPGYRTPQDLLRLRTAIVAPHDAPANGLVAGLYASLWADAFAGGQGELEAGPPWNLDLLALGPLLGTFVSVAIVLGWLIGCVTVLRSGDPATALAPALLVTGVAAALWIGLGVPIISIAKASYAMVALATPLAALGALGLDRLAGRVRWRSSLVLTLLLAWAAVSYATYLVRSSAPATLALAGRRLLAVSDEEQGIVDLRAALSGDPGNWAARGALAETLFPAPENLRALEGELARSGALDQAPPAIWLLRGHASAQAGNEDQAIVDLQRAAMSPAFIEPRLELAMLHGRRGELDDAARWARDVVRLSAEQTVAHEVLAEVYQLQGKRELARYHRGWVTRLSAE